MDEKSSSTRKLSGDKQKKSSKKRRKTKHKDRDGERLKRAPGILNTAMTAGFKSSSPDETNSDSALVLAKRRAKKKLSLTTDSRTVESSTQISKVPNNVTTSGSTSAPPIVSCSRKTSNSSSISGENHANHENSVDFKKRTSQTSIESDVSETASRIDESLRWDNVCSDPVQEAERIHIYKINRRKRYLAESLRKRSDKASVLSFAKEIAACEDW